MQTNGSPWGLRRTLRGPCGGSRRSPANVTIIASTRCMYENDSSDLGFLLTFLHIINYKKYSLMWVNGMKYFQMGIQGLEFKGLNFGVLDMKMLGKHCLSERGRCLNPGGSESRSY